MTGTTGGVNWSVTEKCTAAIKYRNSLLNRRSISIFRKHWQIWWVWLGSLKDLNFEFVAVMAGIYHICVLK